MSTLGEEECFRLKQWARNQHQVALSKHHRCMVMVSGDEVWCHDVVETMLMAVGLHSAYWVTEREPLPEQSMSAAQVRRLLGQDTEAVVFNAWSRFDPDAFAAVSGTINGGGCLFLLTPVLEAWPSFSDPDNARITVYPKPAQRLAGRYVRRLVNVIRESNDVLRIEQNKVLPRLVTVPTYSVASLLHGGEYRTADQQKAVEAIEKVVTGHRRRPLVITSDRGRGKTSSLGIAAAHLLKKGISRIIITAPRYAMAERVFFRAKQLLPEAVFSRGLIVDGKREIQFLPPDELLRRLPQADLVCVDEAAGIPASLLEKLLQRYARIVFASTVHGYEGSGRGFAIRFQSILDERTPGWTLLSLITPIRWADNDPLESFVSRAMLLDASLPDAPIHKDFNAARMTVECLDRDDLLGNDKLLTQLFGLLVQAHYQTRPIDLRHLLDGPNISVYVIRDSERVYATALVASEGRLDGDISQQIFAGKRRPQGHLLPQTLMAQGGFIEAGALSYCRVIRIAVDPSMQRHGLGSALLTAVIQEARNKQFDCVGASFSILPGMLDFWRSCHFKPVLIGMTKNAASGAHSVVVLQGISVEGEALHHHARQRFNQTFPHWLSDPLRELDTGIVLELLHQTEGTSLMQLSERDRQDIDAFADGLRGYEVNLWPLWTFICASLPLSNVVCILSGQESSLLIAKVLQKRGWQEVAKLVHINGRAAVIATMRKAVRKMVRYHQKNSLWK